MIDKDLNFLKNIDLTNTSTLEEVDEEIDVTDDIVNACKVLLFNDEWHTFDEVIYQIIKAVRCTYHHAETLTYEVHEKGKALVFSGDLSECLKVSGVLEEIALHTQIEM
ncbi:MAG: ATP-dependent Clp protease adaptor ClpS [Candidatus Kapabacteria bacterium]|nr:ATP-dependent Clp protease adaptor ClpS [Ignavibacteriota bacterium]MCW5884521.1 ATP-dependent Clp protease adaptor ClpS [Candidatus Kapabacteria bacterium]